ncbi:hypothetical protein ERO13_D11G272233v2 [Gossypium hirsutum]|uniref:Retrotransposon gag domain-containing protein n=2 Tax=Gossypium TaxID=3633 RepID=A0A5J5PH72_GOSBA|nr:hypothetical protein ES319_D11G297100v1 [Gossypium barbadense]KAG4122532.1 hypothetical protein ERO13_D11G272233v2 [Gossypium hirsutum]TYH46181.1 hypothetical protein ES332_D11G317200v1 [Gossypium tomentosum]
MTQASQERMQTLKENNKKMMKTISKLPYPKDYTSPKFKQFNGKTSDTREHVMKFVQILKVPRLEDNLKLKEFSKSLTEKTYTYQMYCMIREKFFSTPEKVTFIDLRRDKKVLNIQEDHYEKELIKVCF